MDRVSADVCRRGFSSPEALTYELLIAPAVTKAVARDVDGLLPRGHVLDVGAGGGMLAECLGGGSRAVVAIDPSRSQAQRIARRRTQRGTLSALRAVAGDLPFRSHSFDGIISCCAVKHWPDPVAGLAECGRVAQHDAPIVIIEVDGDASDEVFGEFARLTRIPLGLRGAYTRFAMRTVVSVAPSGQELEKYLIQAGLVVRSLDRMADTPFLMAHVRPRR